MSAEAELAEAAAARNDALRQRMRGARRFGPALIASICLAFPACGDDATIDDGPPANPAPAEVGTPTDTPAPEATTAVPEETPAAEDTAVPDELVGTWVSTGSGGAEIIYEFSADGTYKYAGVLLQQRQSGMFSFQRSAAGSFEVDGPELVLQPQRGTEKIEDPDVPSASGETPIDTSPERVAWAMTGSSQLQLTGADGTTITYARQ